MTMLRGRAEAPVSLDPVAGRRQMTPVNWWAALGACVLALEAYVLIAWVTGPNFKSIPSGPDEAPDWMVVLGRTWEIGGLVPVAFFVYWFLIRQWRRAGHITTDGMLVLVFISLFWQDPFLNYFQNWGTYNTDVFAFSRGNWAAELPGWVSPTGGNLAEPLIWTGSCYVYVFFGAAVVGSWMMRQARTRWPQMGNLGLIGICFLTCVTFDLLVEVPFTRLGFYTFAGAIPEWTLFHGHYYQFPVYEALTVGAMFTGFAALRFFVDDRGLTFAEKGVRNLDLYSPKRVARRTCALVGAVNLIMFASYSVPLMYLGIHSGEWPRDIVERSYFTDRMCGPETDYACPGPNVPIPRKNSQYVDNEGQLAGGTQ